MVNRSALLVLPSVERRTIRRCGGLTRTAHLVKVTPTELYNTFTNDQWRDSEITHGQLPLLSEPEISFENGVPLPPNVRPVIVVKGSDYEMGYQYYQQLVQIFGRWVAGHQLLRSPRSDLRFIGPWFLKEIKHKDFTDDELTILKKWEAQFIQYTPEMIDMYKGMADGATDAGIPLSYLDVLAHFTGYPSPLLASGHGLLAETACSGFAAWGSTTKDGKLICASNGDDQENYFSTTIIAFPETGNNFIYSPFNVVAFGGFPCHPGMNNKGLVHIHHGGGTNGKEIPSTGVGIPRGVTTLHTLRFANTAAEALDMLLTYPYGIRAGGLWADTEGNAFCIECREPKVIRRLGYVDEQDFIFASNNCISRELGGKDEIWVSNAGWLGGNSINISSIPRNLEMWNMLHYYQGKVDLDFAKMMYRYVGKPPDYLTLEEASATYLANKGKGWDQTICNQLNAVVGITLPDNGDDGLYYVCTGCATRIAYPLLPLPDGLTYNVAPTHSFYQLKLASCPEEVVTSARAQAQYDLYYANVELRKLNYLNDGYAALDTIFNQAVTAWFGGEYYLGAAISDRSTRNESVYRYAKAVRAFTRCQALAKHIHNSLVPPASSPEDLGLKLFGYWENY
ncbi:hypothetical protein ACFLT8_01895 [Chloroflexota bacterium]